jgi:hypothetical protein
MLFWGASSTLCNIQNPSRQWDMATIKSIFIGCVILHNLIIEDEYNCNLEQSFNVGSNVSHLKQGFSFEDYCQKITQIENVATHYNLKNDLVEHLWARKNNNAN